MSIHHCDKSTSKFYVQSWLFIELFNIWPSPLLCCKEIFIFFLVFFQQKVVKDLANEAEAGATLLAEVGECAVQLYLAERLTQRAHIFSI